MRISSLFVYSDRLLGYRAYRKSIFSTTLSTTCEVFAIANTVSLQTNKVSNRCYRKVPARSVVADPTSKRAQFLEYVICPNPSPEKQRITGRISKALGIPNMPFLVSAFPRKAKTQTCTPGNTTAPYMLQPSIAWDGSCTTLKHHCTTSRRGSQAFKPTPLSLASSEASGDLRQAVSYLSKF